MNDLVRRLTREQQIEASLRPEPSRKALKEAVERGLVHVRFVETRGGTELGVQVAPAASDLSALESPAGGSIRLVGDLILDYSRVRFHGTIDLDSLKGQGRLEHLGDVAPGASLDEVA
jgi:hypothetical protein